MPETFILKDACLANLTIFWASKLIFFCSTIAFLSIFRCSFMEKLPKSANSSSFLLQPKSSLSVQMSSFLVEEPFFGEHQKQAGFLGGEGDSLEYFEEPRGELEKDRLAGLKPKRFLLSKPRFETSTLLREDSEEEFEVEPKRFLLSKLRFEDGNFALPGDESEE